MLEYFSLGILIMGILVKLGIQKGRPNAEHSASPEIFSPEND